MKLFYTGISEGAAMFSMEFPIFGTEVSAVSNGSIQFNAGYPFRELKLIPKRTWEDAFITQVTTVITMSRGVHHGV